MCLWVAKGNFQNVDSDYVGLEQGLSFYVSNKLPGAADTSDLQRTFWLYQMPFLHLHPSSSTLLEEKKNHNETD